MRRVITAVVVLLALAAGLTGVRAQDASPVSLDAVACDGEVRDVDELLALWYGDATAPDATPVTPGDIQEEETPPTEITIQIGEPADAATTAAVTDTILQVTACFAAGDMLRAYALFTDDLATRFGPEPGTPRSDAEAFLATGDDDDEDEGDVEGQSELLSVANVMILPDGRASAFIVDRYAAGDALTLVIFEQVGDRWLADEAVEFPTSLFDGEE